MAVGYRERKTSRKTPKEFALWCTGLRIRLQCVGSLQRHGFDPQPREVTNKISDEGITVPGTS